MAQSLYNLSNIIFAIAAFFLVATVFIWFHYKIPAVHDDVSGKKVRRSIAETRARNERTGRKEFKPSETNIKRGKKTTVIEDSKIKEEDDFKPDTGVLTENKADDFTSEGTGVLDEATDLLEEGTCLLNEEGKEQESNECCEDRMQSERVNIKLLEEVMLIHTKEVIR